MPLSLIHISGEYFTIDEDTLNDRLAAGYMNGINDKYAVYYTAKEYKMCIRDRAEYDQRWADFKDRMRAMQRLNDGGSIALLSSATNLYQLLTLSLIHI